MSWLLDIRRRVALWIYPDDPEPTRETVSVVRYFVSYISTHSEFHNGGPKQFGYGMATIDLKGGISKWDEVMALSTELEQGCMKDGQLNPDVNILSITPIYQYEVDPTLV